MNAETTPVLIVGGGPTGLTASRLLSNLKIAHVLIERRDEPQKAPAAHVINRRTMEIFRQAGLPMESLYALDKHADKALAIRWKSALREPSLATVRLERVPESGDLSAEHVANISQPLLERGLLAEAEKSEFASIRFGHEWLGFGEDGNSHHRVQAKDGSTYEISADYTLAADGAGSSLRRSLGIGKSGPDNIATFLSLSCEVDLTDEDEQTDDLLTWCLDPKFSGVMITHDPQSLTVVMRQIHEPHERAEDYDEATCHTMLTALFGRDVPYKLLNRDTWRMTAQVADQFRVGNVFLVGDAAHRFPPTGGLGLNSGVADVHNLVWKIAAHRDGAPDALLDSYETERMPVVQANCDASLENFRRMDEVIDAIGLDVGKASLPARILGAPLVRALPKGVRGWLFGCLTAPARKILDRAAAVSADGEQKRRAIQAAADRQRPHFDMPQLELGYVYPAGAAIADGSGQRFQHVDLGGEGNPEDSVHAHFDYSAYTLLTGEGDLAAPDIATFDLPLRRFVVPGLGLNNDEWILVRPDGHVADQNYKETH